MTNKKPMRGEIWLINFDPTVGAEIQKTRPGLILSSDSLGTLPLRIVAPLTGWRDDFKDNIWHVKISPKAENGLKKDSAIDLLQIKSFDEKRFLKKIGNVQQKIIEEAVIALLNVIDYEPN